MAKTVLQRFAYSGAPRFLGSFDDAVTIVRVNLLERRRGLQLLGRISQRLLIRNTVVKPLAFHIYNRDQVGRVLTDQVKQFFPFDQLSANAVDQKVLIDGVEIKEENQSH